MSITGAFGQKGSQPPHGQRGVALALRVVAGLLAGSFQLGVALSHGGEAIGYAPGSGANIVVALGVGSGVGCIGSGSSAMMTFGSQAIAQATTALDVTVQAEILELLRDLRDRLGSAIVLITHNMGVLAHLADRVVVKNAGKVIETATVAKLFAAPSEDYTRTLLAAVPHLGQGNPEHQPTDEQTEVVLEVDNLGVQFPGGFKAVDAVTFH